MKISIIDTGHLRAQVFAAAAARAGLPHELIGLDAKPDGDLVYMLLTQVPPTIERDRKRALELCDQGCRMIHDRVQQECYENKVAQAERFAEWMPRTTVIRQLDHAIASAGSMEYPLISKSAQGCASINVRTLHSDEEAAIEALQAFSTTGIQITRCKGAAPEEAQRGYLLWQEWIPHDHTWRVATIGDRLNAYKRFNYPDKMVAAPAAVRPVEPVTEITAEVAPILDFARRFFAHAGTRHCAIDILESPRGPLICEMSQSWSWGWHPERFPWLGTEYTLATSDEMLVAQIQEGLWA